MTRHAAITMVSLLVGCSDARPIVDGSEAHSGVHEPGISDQASPNFHGKLALEVGLSKCTPCHGTDFAGGTAKVTCLDCHKQGPAACDTCHGQPPLTGAHVTHAARYDCSSCHPKPDDYTDAHLHTGPAKLITTCSQCHGAANPTWQPDPNQAQCGSCHGIPPASHVDNRCAVCHPPHDSPTHANGTVDLGNGNGTCTACHGQPPQTGAHVAHMTAEHRLSNPVTCDKCHAVPVNVTDPGHIDHLPPATLSSDCNRCHLAATVDWNGAPTEAACGTCHGIPPTDGVHWATLRLTDCAICHPQTMDPSGALKPATHINGVVDVQ
jgi:hypothetical protein